MTVPRFLTGWLIGVLSGIGAYLLTESPSLSLLVAVAVAIAVWAHLFELLVDALVYGIFLIVNALT